MRNAGDRAAPALRVPPQAASAFLHTKQFERGIDTEAHTSGKDLDARVAVEEIRALLSQIASNPSLGDPFRATVVQARRDEIARVIRRGIARGDLRADADTDIATELLVGPVYSRLMFGGDLNLDFANRVVDNVMRGYAVGGRRTAKQLRRRARPPVGEHPKEKASA